MASLRLRGATIFDGTGAKPFAGDVLLRDGKIAALGQGALATAQRWLDVNGAWVVPGFIDAHSHADLAVLTGEGMETRARAGVTTEIVGQDGFSLAPLSLPHYSQVAESLHTLTGPMASEHIHADVADYLQATRQAGFARVATLLPHACLRAAVVADQKRPATAIERDHLTALVHRQFTPGVLGVSTGLSYPPARWSDVEELIAVLRGVPQHDRRLLIHLRDYGTELEDAVSEAVQTAQGAGAQLHLSHFHVSGPGREGAAPLFLDGLRGKMASSLRITLDSYPYETACTTLLSALPEWFQGLPPADRTELVRSEAGQRRLASDLDRNGPGATFAVGWEGIILEPRNDVGLGTQETTVTRAAQDHRVTPGELVAEVASRTGLDCFALARQGHRDNVLRIAGEPNHVVGSDGILAGDRPPHPRASGTFLRFLRWARDGQLPVDVATMVSKMTGRTASLLGLPGGVLRPGAPADLLVLDPDALTAGPDVGDHVPTAVVHSFLDGHAVIRKGVWLGDAHPLEAQ